MRIILVVFFSFFLGSCAGNYLDGRIVDKQSGLLLPMKIQTSYGQGNMEAFNPTTGENFSGTYTGISEEYSGSVTNFMTGQTVFYSGGSSKANAKAFLTGNKGTTMEVFMVIQKGFRPIGFGEAKDNLGHVYHVEF